MQLRTVLVIAAWVAFIISLSQLAVLQPQKPAISASRSANQTPTPPSGAEPTTVQQPDTSEENRDEEREDRNVKAQETIAALTGALFALAFVQFLITAGGLIYTARAADAAKSSAETARQFLLRENRPRIRIRGVGISGSLNSGRQIARVQLANIGGSRAVNIEFNVGWFVWRTLPSENPAAAPMVSGILTDHDGTADTPITRASIQEGGWRFIETVKADHRNIPNIQPHYLWQDGGDDYITGRVRYEDESGLPRVTAFCRRLNKDTGRFEPVDDPDYEYEE